jgi:organic hydroperoxide reductase OsmC/OhrA
MNESMSEHTARVAWERADHVFTDNRYSRAHAWTFDGGATVRASSSPCAVRPPFSDVSAVDPEEAFVASLASCHMLWFLSIAAGRGFRVDSYVDDAVGVMGKNADGRTAMTRVTLRPRAVFSGDKQPAPEEIEAMHHEAHEECFIASSVKTEVRCEPG